MRARVEFLWYKVGNKIKDSEFPDNVALWLKEGLVEDDSVVVKKPVVKEEVRVVEKIVPEIEIPKKVGRWGRK